MGRDQVVGRGGGSLRAMVEVDATSLLCRIFYGDTVHDWLNYDLQEGITGFAEWPRGTKDGYFRCHQHRFLTSVRETDRPTLRT